MSRHVVFFIHGMGKHDATWHEKGLKVMSSAWKQYDNLDDDTLEEWVEPVPVVYDDVFETWRQRMQSDFDGFQAALLGSTPDVADEDASQIKKISDKLDKIGEWIGAGEDEFVWTHAADVILYRFIKTIRSAIDVSVISQILKRVQQGNFKTWSIVAHSLGTSVAHNCINSLYGAGVDGIRPLDPRETRPRVIMMVANVSRVCERPGARVYDSRVKPGEPTTNRTCGYYLNVRHKLDPFTHPRPFDRDPWPDAATFSTDRYQHIRPGHVQFGKSELMRVHDLDHYVENPRVHVPFFRALLGNIFIPEDEFTKARAGFDAAQNSDWIDAARAALEPKLPAPGRNWDALVDLFRKLT